MARTSSTQQEKPYHHGDLRRAIVDAALAILSETQSTEFSLRELARRAGVSHNAPYKHFAEKRELLAAVSAAGFELLAKRMVRAASGLGDPRQALSAMVRAYTRHGLENPALYRLMFGGFLGEQSGGRPAIEQAAADRVRTLFAGAISAGALGTDLPQKASNERKIAGTLLAYWSVLHGLTLLIVDGLVGPKDKSDRLCEMILEAMRVGFAKSLPVLPQGTWVGPQ